MTDDIDITWDWGPTLHRFEESLHAPYVIGTQVKVYVSSEDEILVGWRVESTDESIFKIEDTTLDPDGHFMTVQGRAIGPGNAELVVIDDSGDTVGSGSAEVGIPDHIELDAHGYLLLDQERDARVDELRIVEGGTATYLVRYFQGERELHGNGVLTIDDNPTVHTEARTTFLLENREWLTVTSDTVGTQPLALRAAGHPVTSVDVVTVPETDIDTVTLLTPSEAHADEGTWLTILAQAHDAQRRRIFGVDYQWMIEGVMETDAGDLYRYKFKAGDYKNITAIRGGHQASATIQSEEGFVDTTNYVGCNAGGAGGGFFVVLAVGGLVWRRRRRNPIRAERSRLA